MNELLTFFAVLVRYSVLFAIVPILGDRVIPVPIKILCSLGITAALYPALVMNGSVQPDRVMIWGASASQIITTITLEVLFGLALGYCAKLVFDGISFGANLTGNFMGFAAASVFDPHQESQTEVIGQLQTVLAMLLFLAIDGHHIFLRAAMDSYKIVGIGELSLGGLFSRQIIQMTGDTIILGLQISAPVAVSLFLVNIVYGMMAKSMPQLNVLVLSFSVSAILGLVILMISIPEFNSVVGDSFAGLYERLRNVMSVMHG